MATLRPFQERGIQFGIDCLGKYGACLIADEMGLGKTAQALSVCRSLSLEKCLVVTRNGVKSSWVKEIHLWDPDARYVVVPGGQGISALFRQAAIRGFIEGHSKGRRNYLIIHYDVLRLHPELRDGRWDVIIADECQDIKNRKALRTKSLKLLKTRYKMGLSGTPLINRPDELWSLLNWFFPTRVQAEDILGSAYYAGYWKFYERYIKYTMHPYLGVRIIEGTKNEDELHATLEQFMIRRTKKDELKELPDKYYTYIDVVLHPQQQRMYDKMQKDFIAWIGEQEDMPLLAPTVLSQLTRLRMFADAAAELDIVEEDGQVVDMKIHLHEPSAKADTLMDIIRDEDKQFVVFTQFRDMIDILTQRFEKEKIPYVAYHGGVKEEDRIKAIDDFQDGRAKVFIGTPQAGGVGLTLTASDTVIFVDRSWSPAINLQAEDRLHRMGQKNAVQVIVLQAVQTIDVNIEYLLRDKWHMIQKILDGKVEM